MEHGTIAAKDRRMTNATESTWGVPQAPDCAAAA